MHGKKMHRDIRIQHEDFDVAEEWQAARQRCGGDVGAIAVFGGLVRGYVSGQTKDDADVTGLYLEHYPGMTETSIVQFVDEAEKRWDLLDVVIVHRVGELAAEDQIVFVQVASGHRPDAFAACEFLMDHLKTDAVFWKKERRAAGDTWIEATGSDHQRRSGWQSARGS